MKYIDAHAHIHGKDFDIDRDDVIARMKEKELGCITVGTSLEDSKKAVNLAQNNDNIWATIGVHPTDTKDIFEENDFEELVKNEKVVAIGECGLDYYRGVKSGELGVTSEEKKRQKENFIRQIEFALKYDKPLMVHCRPSNNRGNDAHDDMISILNSYLVTHNSATLRGVIHFFTGTREIAEKYFSLGFSVSIPGVVTFSNEVEEMVRALPIEKILAETDCPYATPVPFRGKRNEPIYVMETIKKIAEIKGFSLNELEKQLVSNVKKTFNI
ncbi:MAG: TatD family hydrolase [Patescibacteria group bacterium]